MPLGDNVIGERQAQTRSFAGGLGGEERLKDLGPSSDSGMPVPLSIHDFDRVSNALRANPNSWLIFGIGDLPGLLRNGVERIVVEVQQHPANLLRCYVYRFKGRIKVGNQLAVETGLVLWLSGRGRQS